MPIDPKGYHGLAPLLTGVRAYGETLGEVKKNLKEAIPCRKSILDEKIQLKNSLVFYTNDI